MGPPEREPSVQIELDERPRTMIYWLARTLREARQGAGVSLAYIVTILRTQGQDISESTLSRLEKPKPLPPKGEDQSYPKAIERIVAAYAQALGMTDGRLLWERALRSWQDCGGAPIVGDLTPEMRAVWLAAEAEQRSRPDDGESQSEPSATTKRRKAR